MESEQLFTLFQNHITAPKATIDAIVAQFEEKKYTKNDFFLKEGKVSNAYYFLVDGFMRAFTLDTEGNEVTTNFFGKNKVVFEVSSFFLQTISTESIQAVTDCRGFSISFEKLNTLFHSFPEFREFGRMMLVKNFAAFKQRTLSLINKSAEERYAELMQSNPEIFQHAQLKHIASYLGVTDTSLSRIRRAFLKKE